LFLFFVPISIIGVNASIPGYESFFLARLVLFFLVLTFIVWAFISKEIFINKLKLLFQDKFLFLPLVFILWTLLSFAWSQDLFLSVRYFVLLCTGVTFFYLAIFVVDSKWKQAAFFRMMIFAVLITLAVALGEIINEYFRMPNSNLIGKPERFLSSVTTFFRNQNDYSTYLSLMLPAFLAPLAIFKKKWVHHLGFFGAVAVMFVSSFNNSRINTLVIVAAGLLFLFYLTKRRRGNRANLIVVLGVASAYLLYLLDRVEVFTMNGYMPVLILMVFLAIIVYEIISKKDSLSHFIAFFMIVIFLMPTFGLQFKSFVSEKFFSRDISHQIARGQDQNKIDLSDLENVGENSLSVRLGIVENTFVVMNDKKHRYLVGVGAGSAEVYMGQFDNIAGIANLHNWWLEIFANLGLMGFIVIGIFSLYLLWVNLALLLKKKDIYSFFSVFSLFILAIVALSPSSMTWQIYPWFIYAFAAVNYLINKEDYENPLYFPPLSNKRK
jgi:hypothetical protein